MTSERSIHLGSVTGKLLSWLLVLAPIVVVVFAWPRASRDTPLKEIGDPLVGHLSTDDRYIGSRACAHCHPGEYAAYTNSGHARTLRMASRHPIAQRLDGRWGAAPDSPGVEWQFVLDDRGLMVQRNQSEATQQMRIDYAFGSGLHATTFLTLTSEDPERARAVEHHITHYARDDKLAMTPGHAQFPDEMSPMGRELSTAETMKCFRCHTTRTSKLGDDVLDVASLIPNISCERCHGPARAHVSAMLAGLEGPTLKWGDAAEASADDEMEFCGRCHRHPSRVERAELYPGNPKMARFQPIALMQSNCYQGSSGSLRCITCHDPHSRSRSDPLSYDPICVKCHDGDDPTRPACTVASSGGCVSCHMPKVEFEELLVFTDHWIRVDR